MLARYMGRGREWRTRWRSIDLPASTVAATDATRGDIWKLELLVEPGDDEMRVRAQAGGNLRRVDDVTERPMKTILAFQPTDVYLEADAYGPDVEPRDDGRPPYSVPGLAEILSVPWNGGTVASTFSGSGGSSLGYIMAGFRVLAAVEIHPLAAASYRRNIPGCAVLERDVRDLEPAELLAAAGVQAGELDVLDGSPPCTSFSTAGIRQKGWGKAREHAGKTQRVDDLFFEFARLLNGCQPRCFVAENVAGLARGAARGYYNAISAVLRRAGYAVHCKLLDADWLGVPQHRERLFFVGVRRDVAERLGMEEADLARLFPKPLPYQYTVRDALPWLDGRAEVYNEQGTPFGDPERIAAGKATPAERVHDGERPAATLTPGKRDAGVRLVQDTGGTTWEGEPNRRELSLDAPVSTLSSGSNGSNNAHWKVVETEAGRVLKRKFTILEVKRLCSFPDDYELEGRFPEQWAQLGNSVPPLMMRAVACRIRDELLAPLARSSEKPRKRRAAGEPRKRAGGRQGRAGRGSGGS